MRGAKLTLAHGWGRWEIILFVNSLDSALETAEERLGANESTLQIYCAGELVYYIQLVCN